MIKLLVLLIAFSINSFAEEDCEDTSEIQSIAKDLAIPNCLTLDNFDNAKRKQISKLCNDCKSKFEKLYPVKMKPVSIQTLQKQFLETALKDYKKSVTNNLIQAVKLGSLPQTGTDFKEATIACKMKTQADVMNDCNSPTAKKLIAESPLFGSLSTQLSGELAQILNTNPNFKAKETILDRSQNACFIPEKDILYIANTTYEEAFSPELIDALKGLDPSKYKTLDSVFLSDAFSDNYEGDVSELKVSLSSHPYMSELLKSPESFLSFFKSIKSPSSTKNLKDALYNKKSGNSFDSKLANDCSSSFKALKAAICSPSFESGDISLDYFQNYSKIHEKDFEEDQSPYASSDSLIIKNINLLSYCDAEKQKKSLKLSSVSELLTTGLESKYKEQNFSFFKTNKYDDDFGRLTKALCSMTDSTCIEGNFTCSIYKKLKATKDTNTLDSKLANSSNKEINTLLRSMIGDDTKNLDAATKEILVSRGIIPKDDGTLVAQAEIPERQPGFFNQPQEVQNKPAATVAAAAPVKAPARRSSSSNSDYSPGPVSNLSATPLPDFSDLYKDNDLKDIEDEIKRRLSALPDNKPATKEAAKKIARDSFQSRGRAITPSQENAFASRMMASAPDSQVNAGAGDDNFNSNEANREAAVSNSASAAEKWKKDGMNRALADMQGAKQGANTGAAGRDPASAPDDANAKDLTTVALNIAEDPKVSLSQSLSEKISKNDSETQLLQVLVKNKTNFILQVKSVNFKVIFDDQKQLRILVESGDSKEAERLRPQLEIFFKRLNRL